MPEFKCATITPPKNKTLICSCPDWCDEGFQVAKWNGERFYYSAQPNEMFHGLVKEWAILEVSNDR